MGMPEATADCVAEGGQGEAGGGGAGALALGAAFLTWANPLAGAFLLEPFLEAVAVGQDGDAGTHQAGDAGSPRCMSPPSKTGAAAQRW